MVWVHNNTSAAAGQHYAAGMNNNSSRTGQNQASGASRGIGSIGLKLMGFAAAKLASKVTTHLQSSQSNSAKVQSALQHVQARLQQIQSDLSADLRRLATEFGITTPQSEPQPRPQPGHQPGAQSRTEPEPPPRPQSKPQPGPQNAQGSSQQPPDGWTVHNGVHHRRVVDEEGAAWHETFNPATGQHFSKTGWSAADPDGTQSRRVRDNRTGMVLHETRNSSTGQHLSMTDWSAADADGTQSRRVFDHQTEVLWEEDLNIKSGLHMSRSSRTDHEGTRWDTTYNHKTGEHISMTGYEPAQDGSGQEFRRIYDHRANKTHEGYRDPTGGMTKEKACEVLGVPANASYKEAQKAFRKLSRELHPDVNPDPKVAERYKEVNKAWEFLEKTLTAKSQT